MSPVRQDAIREDLKHPRTAQCHRAFEATEQNGARTYRYRGTYTIGGLFEGTVCPQTLASPTGFEPVFWP